MPSIALDDATNRRTEGARPRTRVHSALAIDEVDALESSWREMHAGVPSPLGQFNWTRACLAAFPDEATPHVVAAISGARLLALAPLVRKRWRGISRLCLAGAGELLEPMDLVWTDPLACARVLKLLARGGVPLVLERLPADSMTAPLLKRVYRARALVTVRPSSPCPYLMLDESWLEPQNHLSRDERGALRQARHAAEALGEVTTEIHAPDLRDLGPLLDEAFDVEGHGWRIDEHATHRSVPLARDPQRAVFYLQYARAACVEGALRVCFLRVDGRAVAMQIAVEQAGAFWLLRSAGDPQLAACRPELLLARETIRYAAEAGLSTFEFLSTSHASCRAWRPLLRKCVTVNVYPMGLRGLAALVADAGASLYGRFKSHARSRRKRAQVVRRHPVPKV